MARMKFEINPILMDIIVFVGIPIIGIILMAIICSTLLDKQTSEIKQLKHEKREMAYEIQSLRLRLEGQLNIEL